MKTLREVSGETPPRVSVPRFHAIHRRSAAWAVSAGADLLGLAASPTFAIMALLTGVSGDSHDMLCSAGREAGMVLMYLLMSAFHSSSWLRLISGGHGSRYVSLAREGAR